MVMQCGRLLTVLPWAFCAYSSCSAIEPCAASWCSGQLLTVLLMCTADLPVLPMCTADLPVLLMCTAGLPGCTAHVNCRFSHVLTAGAVGRGRGSRALLHQAMNTNRTTNPKSRFYATAQSQPHSSSSSSGTSRTTVGAAAAPVRAVCHDASYWCCLQLQGQQQQLVQLLSSMR